jgi:hypothetical protein
MVSTGIVQLLKAKSGQGGVDSIIHLGYPVYFLSLMGVWKFLGMIAVLIPKFTLVKEWAYAGFSFAMSGAIYSHIAVGDGISAIAPALLLLVLTIISWYFRPASRKMVYVNE